MTELFGKSKGPAPLSERVRPFNFEDLVGLESIVGENTPFGSQIRKDSLSSSILWGPAGSGKTTIARIISKKTKNHFSSISAVLSSIKEVKEVMGKAKRDWEEGGKSTLLFIDEIHRYNRAQQDAFLPYVERGDITLIGATTENPSFEVISALLSRSKVYMLRALTPPEIVTLLERALADRERGLGELGIHAPRELLEQIAIWANGDARSAYNTLEAAAAASPGRELSAQAVEDAIQRKVLLYDKSGEEHYNLISALHKSVRSSDVDASLYWLARMLEAGEDRLYIARRLIRMAIEDIGLADPRALEQAVAAMQAVHFLGIPEGDQALAQTAIYLAVAPKSDAAYQALNQAQRDVAETVAEPVPLHLRNPVTSSMRAWGYGQGYQHAHDYKDAIPDMTCLPESLAGRRYYYPTDRGIEKRIAERMDEIRRARGNPRPPSPRSEPS
ncbi:MAG: replication-associated recombination protein A [Acidobacteriota bacterium]